MQRRPIAPLPLVALEIVLTHALATLPLLVRDRRFALGNPLTVIGDKFCNDGKEIEVLIQVVRPRLQVVDYLALQKIPIHREKPASELQAVFLDKPRWKAEHRDTVEF